MPSKNWTFLTNHGIILLHLAEHPCDTIRLASDHLNLAERTVAGIIADLRQSGYLSADKRGTRNVYSLNTAVFMRETSVPEHPVADLLSALSTRRRKRGMPSDRGDGETPA